MVFSFFKKDPKGPKKGAGGQPKPTQAGPRTSGATEVQTRPTAKPIGRTLAGPVTRAASGASSPAAAFPTTETAIPDRERARNRALETAAKIDAIESEMARDLLRGLGRNPNDPPTAPAPAAAEAAPTAPARPQPAPVKPAVDEATEPMTDTLGGDMDAIEINTSGAGSIIDETAILFSNGQCDEAEAVLRAGLRNNDLGQGTRMAWHMLFELINQRGDKAGFEQLTMDYVMRFEHSPPAWVDYVDTPASRPVARAAQPAPSGAPSVHLPESIDAGIVMQLEQLRALTAAHAAVQLDVSESRNVDIAGADLLLRVLNAFKRGQRELTLVGASPFLQVLSRSVQSGRREPSDAVWMLLLEVQRMLGRQEQFEDTAIEYCITFEMSPPSWEPAPANLKVAAAPTSVAVAPASVGEVAPAFELRGVIEGEGEPQFGRLVAAARSQPQVAIDCSQLRRLAFSAGSAMLGMLRRMQQGGSTVELHNVNALVAALLHLLGVTLIISVQPRRG